MKVKVTADVVITHNDKTYAKGDAFSIKENEFAALDEFVSKDGEDEAEDSSKEPAPKANEELTVDEIKALLDEAGREYPKSAKKDELLTILNG